MTKLYQDEIAQKLNRMFDRINRLQHFVTITLETYLANEDYQHIIELHIERLIQSSLDINKMLLKRVVDLDRDNTFNNDESFMLMGKYNFLPTSLSAQLASSRSLGDILAYHYDEINLQQVYVAFQQAITQYPQYIRNIQIYLDTLASEEPRSI